MDSAQPYTAQRQVEWLDQIDSGGLRTDNVDYCLFGQG